MRLTTRTNLAMRTLMCCAVNDGTLVRKSEIAKTCGASENHLGQVINSLSQHGFIETVRGRSGGLQLGRDPKEISVGSVFRCFEADLPFAECFENGEIKCPIAPCCRLQTTLKTALAAFYGVLDAVTLEDLVEGNTELHDILRLSEPLIALVGASGKPPAAAMRA